MTLQRLTSLSVLRRNLVCSHCGKPITTAYRPETKNPDQPPFCIGCSVFLDRWRRANDHAYNERNNETRRVRRAMARLEHAPKPAVDEPTTTSACRGCGMLFLDYYLTDGLCMGQWCPGVK